MIRIPKFDDGLNSETLQYAMDLLTKGEGFRPTVYWDSIGKKNTAGYGFTDPKDLHSWTEAEARKKLQSMATNYHRLLSSGRIADQYKKMGPHQQAALIDLIHQGGTGVLGEMPKFVKLVNSGDLVGASKELDFARKQTPNRYKARLNSWTNGLETPEQIAEQKILESQTMPTDAVRVNRDIQMPVMRYDDPATPRSISWTAGVKQKPDFKSILSVPKLPTIQEFMEQQFNQKYNNLTQPLWTVQ